MYRRLKRPPPVQQKHGAADRVHTADRQPKIQPRTPHARAVAATARADRWLRERLDLGSLHDPSGDVPVRAFVSQGIDQIVRSSDSTSRRRDTASAPSSLTCADTWHRAHAVDWCLTVLRGRRTTCFKGFFEGLLVELLHEVGCGHGSRIGRSSRFAPQRSGVDTSPGLPPILSDLPSLPISGASSSWTVCFFLPAQGQSALAQKA